MPIRNSICQNKHCGIPFYWNTSKRSKANSPAKYCSPECSQMARLGSGRSYPRIKVNGKRVYMHRWVVEQLVRPLKEGEIVHHINENKYDWNVENLEIVESQAEHIRRHNLTRSQRVEEDYEFYKAMQKMQRDGN